MNVSLSLFHAVKRFKGNDKIGHGITAVAKLLDCARPGPCSRPVSTATRSPSPSC
jgi:hypothetical protein